MSFRLLSPVIFFFLSIQIDCNQPASLIPGDLPFISLDIENQIKFKSDSMFVTSFIISPIEKDHLWVFGNSWYDLDLKSGKWSSLLKILDHYALGLRPENVHLDTIQPNLVWITNFHEGICLLNSDTRTFISLGKTDPIEAIGFTAKEAWIGTWKGLYRFDRSSSKLELVNECGSLYITSIEIQKDQSLILNHQFKFNPQSRSVIEINQPQPRGNQLVLYPNMEVSQNNSNDIWIIREGSVILSKDFSIYWPHILFEKEDIWIPSQELRDGITHIDVASGKIDTIPMTYQFFIETTSSDRDFLWMTNPDEILSVEKQTGQAHVFFNPEVSKFNFLMSDNRYVYYSDGSGITIANKKKFISSSKPEEEATKEWKSFTSLQDSLQIRSLHSIKDINSANKILEQRFKNSQSRRIYNLIQQQIGYALSSLLYVYPSMDTTIFLLADSITDSQFQLNIYKAHIHYFALNGKLDAAVAFAEMHPEVLKDSTEQYFNEIFTAIRHCRDTIKIINRTIQQEDIRLWYYAQVYQKLMNSIGLPSEDSSTDHLFPYSFLQQLLEKYPQSPLADNAEWLMSHTEENQSHEGGDTEMNRHFIEDCERIIRKYPNSEILPEIYQSIAELYNGIYEPDMDQKKILFTAASYIQKIKKEYPEYAKKREVIALDESIQQSIEYASWELKVTSDRTMYYSDDPVYITYQLTNENEHPLPISLFQDSILANFIIVVTYKESETEYQYQYVQEISNLKSIHETHQDSIILPTHSYIEVKNIKESARTDYYYRQSHFNFDRPGVYSITGMFPLNYHEGMVRGEPISFTVVK